MMNITPLQKRVYPAIFPSRKPETPLSPLVSSPRFGFDTGLWPIGDVPGWLLLVGPVVLFGGVPTFLVLVEKYGLKKVLNALNPFHKKAKIDPFKNAGLDAEVIAQSMQRNPILRTAVQQYGKDVLEKLAPRLLAHSRVLMFKTLLDTNEQGQSGWDILVAIHQQELQKGFLGRRFSKGVTTQALTAFGKPVSVLEKLKDMGFLRAKGVGESVKWSLSGSGEALMAQGHPLTSGAMSKEDINDLLDLKISDLEEQKLEHVRFVDKLRRNHREAQAMRGEIIQPEQRQSQDELVNRAKLQLEVAEALKQEEETRIAVQMTEIRQAQMRLKMSDADEKTLALLGRQGQAGAFPQLAGQLMDSIFETYTRTASHVETEKALANFDVRQRVREQLKALEQQPVPPQASHEPSLAQILQTGKEGKQQPQVQKRNDP